MSLSLTQVQPRKTGPDMTEKKVDWDVKNQTKVVILLLQFLCLSVAPIVADIAICDAVLCVISSLVAFSGFKYE